MTNAPAELKSKGGDTVTPDQWVEALTDAIHDLCLETRDSQIPSWAEVKGVIEEFISSEGIKGVREHDKAQF